MGGSRPPLAVTCARFALRIIWRSGSTPAGSMHRPLIGQPVRGRRTSVQGMGGSRPPLAVTCARFALEIIGRSGSTPHTGGRRHAGGHRPGPRCMGMTGRESASCWVGRAPVPTPPVHRASTDRARPAMAEGRRRELWVRPGATARGGSRARPRRTGPAVRGAIVALSSAAARRPSERSTAPYTAARAGIELLTKSAAIQAGPYSVRVNCIAPGTISTERTRTRSPRK